MNMDILPHDAAWEPIRKTVYADRPGQRFDCLPVWSLDAIYEGPDGEVPRPESYRGEDGVVEWELRVKKKKESFTDADKDKETRTYYYFENRHLDPRFHVEHYVTS